MPHSRLILLVLLALAQALPPASREEQLWEHRNLGKAFYEDPAGHNQAVEEFRKALDLAPDSPRERLNYGLALLRAGRRDEGAPELERVQREAPRSRTPGSTSAWSTKSAANTSAPSISS